MLRRALTGLGTALLLTACGGGGGGAGDTFIDNSPGFGAVRVQGLYYETATKQGFTGPRGEFDFEPGETIEFRLGDTVLGSAPAKARMTTLDLVPGSEIPTTNRSFNRLLRSNLKSPTAHLMNIIVLLHTLDSDGNLGNGVQVPELIHTLLAGTDIPLDVIPEHFHGDIDFRTLLRDGASAGLWGGATRPIASYARATERVIDALAMGHQFEQASEFRIDRDADGVFDARTEMVRLDDLRMEWRDDTDGDGVVDVRSVFSHTPWGELARSELDTGNDGTIDQVSEFTFDAWQLRHQYRRYEAGVLKSVATDTRDDLGYLRTTERDFDADGTIDERSTLHYNTVGLLERHERDRDNDGDIDSITAYTYDANRYPRYVTRDNDADGVADEVSRSTYDDRGRRLTDDRDGNGDGVFDSLTRFIYDDANLRVIEEEDNNADGTVDRRTVILHDVLGRTLRIEEDRDHDGLIDRVRTFTYFADRMVEENDRDNDGIVDERRVSEFNAAGNETRYSVDYGADGVLDEVIENDFRPGRPGESLLQGQS